MKKIIQKFIVKLTGYTIVRANTQTDMVSWVKDAEFEATYSTVCMHTLLGKDRLFMLWQVVKQAKKLPGSMAQVGIFRGGSARLIAQAKLGNTSPFYLFDTFEGMPKVNETVDIHREGDFKDTSLAVVKEIFYGISDIVFCKGVFPHSSGPAKLDSFSFVYIDVDIYQSVLDSVAFFYSRMAPGGFMIFDDYKGKHTPGVKMALDEFFKDKKEVPLIIAIGQCMIIKQ